MARSIVKRGSLIVFEGCDRSGKTTACKRLVDYFNLNQNNSAKFMRFPDRSTEVGQAIDGYLKEERELDDHVIHLLFSANRWEKVRLALKLKASTYYTFPPMKVFNHQPKILI